MPGTMRSASCRLVAPVSAISFSETIDTDFGVSSSSAVNFGEDGLNQLPRTCTLSRSVALREEAASALSAACAANGAKPAARVAVASRETRGARLRDVMWVMAWVVVAGIGKGRGPKRRQRDGM